MGSIEGRIFAMFFKARLRFRELNAFSAYELHIRCHIFGRGIVGNSIRVPFKHFVILLPIILRMTSPMPIGLPHGFLSSELGDMHYRFKNLVDMRYTT